MNLHNDLVECYDIIDDLMKSKTINKKSKQKLSEVRMKLLNVDEVLLLSGKNLTIKKSKQDKYFDDQSWDNEPRQSTAGNSIKKSKQEKYFADLESMISWDNEPRQSTTCISIKKSSRKK
jgi:hypothetical protein